MNYLFNGIKLPALPERDKTTYPYAQIVDYGIYYMLTFSSDKPTICYHEFNDGMFDIAYKHSKVPWYSKSFLTEENKWSVLGTYEQDLQYSRVVGDIIWASFDLENEDGSIYLSASDPVPVGGAKWKKHDVYKPNTKWDGNTFYKVIGNKWEKKDAVAPAE